LAAAPEKSSKQPGGQQDRETLKLTAAKAFPGIGSEKEDTRRGGGVIKSEEKPKDFKGG
jgi:hypothetical protein